MLDDIAKIAEVDADGALEVAAGQSQQLLHDDYKLELGELGQIENVVLTGMGGSALAGLILRDWLNDQLAVPFVITRDYSLAKFVGKNTLVIASSYSGNTEETLSAAKDASSKGAKVVVVANGGKLEELARDNDYPFAKLPAGFQPRMAVWASLRILADIFDRAGLSQGALDQLVALAPKLAKASEKLQPNVKTADNLAKQIAKQLHNKTPVIYSGPTLAAAAYKWKISFNESAKNVAFCNVFSEFNHNEFMGWSSYPEKKPFAVVELQSNLDHPQIAKRFKISNKLLEGKMPPPIEVQVEGATNIEQMLWTIQLGDFTSLYLAVLNGVNPTPVDLIEDLKRELA